MDRSSAPPKRVDAERNRDRILAVARAAFAAPGAAGRPSMAEIARRADVGMATLYRNFPGRRELLEALYKDEVDAVCAAAAAAPGDTPGERFTAWAHSFAAFIAGKHDIADELLTHADAADPVFSQSRARVMAAGAPLLAAAREAGEIREDLSLEQILDMVIAIGSIHGAPDYSAPILRAALDGLRQGRSGV